MHIVLVEPEIPNNTGNISRTCAVTGSTLHLVRPLGFSTDDKHLKRAGLDYWQYLDLHVYPDWEAFLRQNPGARMTFFSTHAEVSYFDETYQEGDYLVFGRESAGLTPEMYARYHDRLRLIPMPGEFHRSLNLANSASIVLYEAMRQTRSLWDLPDGR